MPTRTRHFLSCVLLIVSGTAMAGAASAAAERSASPPQFPDWTQVEQAVQEHFAGQKGHRADDLISRGQAGPVFDALAMLGWQVADRDEILAQLLPDYDFLVRELRTAAGRRLMRAGGGYAGAYDRLDRLARMPRGRQTIRDLIKAKGGERLIEYLTQTDGGRNLGRQLEHAPRGEDFNRSTGRIYTVEQLLARLRQSYDAADGATNE